MQILVLVFFYFLFGISYGYSTDPPLRDKVQVVVIDPGHGGKDPGAVGSVIQEKEVVLNIAMKAGKYIEDHFEDVKIIYTRETDVFVPLDERARIANEANADLFMSIHANAVHRPNAAGTETFVIGRHKDDENFELAKKENSVILLEDNYETKYQGFDPNSIDSYIIFSVMQKTYQGHSLAMARMVQDEFELKARRLNRGVKQAGFVVLWMTTMPSILIETGFLTNPEEEKYLASERGQDYLASAIFRAFRKYKNAIEENSKFARVSPVMKEDTLQNALTADHGEKVPTSSKDLHFKVQIMVSQKQMDPEDPNFKNYKNVKTFQSGKWYKYAVGQSFSYDEMESYCEIVRKDFPDAFIIAVRNNEIISLNKALKEIKNMEHAAY